MQQFKINKIVVIALLFSLLSLAGSETINNYYNCVNCTNGTNETTINYSLVYYKNETYNKTDINASLELKLNKTDLNNSVDKNLSNYTNNPGFLTNLTMASDITKLNKSNDTARGYLKFSNKSGSLLSGGMLYQNGSFDENNFSTGYFDITENYVPGVCARWAIGRGWNETQFTSTMGKYGSDVVGYLMVMCGYAANSSSVRGLRFLKYSQNTTTLSAFLSADEYNMAYIGNFTLTNLTGAGNRPLCATPTGKVIIC